ncbi:F-actin-capping protein subunit alpha [Butyriboletus roseoflavus]|nr:F-actin-capping protein subunit alpha [Butyriboletus roseoflavus]
MADSDERIQVASAFVLQSPPGEINDVLNGSHVRAIVSDDDILEYGLLPALRDYNLAQFILVDVPDTNHQTIVSDVARIQDSDEEEQTERFLDPRSKMSFKFDHLRLEASGPRLEDPNPEAEPLRAALESTALSYLAAHYIDGVAAIFASQPPSHFTVQIVSNKYNPANFWSGRWRSQYQIDFAESKTILGKILVNVHYYEQGNVQLETSHELSIPIPPAIANASPHAAANKVFALIEAEETRLQTSLNESYHEMSEKAFKGLRRALPLTRQKIDWDKAWRGTHSKQRRLRYCVVKSGMVYFD